jgi:thioredoxin-related protein
MLKLIFSMLFLANLLLAQSSSDFFDFSSDNLKEDLQSAKEDGKKGIFIFFGMDDCPFCQKMKANVLNKPEVIKYY